VGNHVELKAKTGSHNNTSTKASGV